MKALILFAMLCFTLPSSAQLYLDLCIGGTINCPSQVEYFVEYDLPGNPTPSLSMTTGCINVSSLPTTVTVCALCSTEIVYAVTVIDCSNTLNRVQVGNGNYGYNAGANFPSPCTSPTPPMNSASFLIGSGSINSMVQIDP